MFDVAPSELLLVAIVALLVIGPKDLPLALRAMGKWIGKVRRMSNHFRAGVETMIREAELAEVEKEWRERNARIMAEHPDSDMLDATAPQPEAGPVMEPLDPPAAPDPVSDPDAAAAAAIARAAPVKAPEHQSGDDPELPLAAPSQKHG